MPEAGKDHSRNWNEFVEWFGTEEVCQAYLSGCVGVLDSSVPRCGSTAEPYRASRSRLMSRDCKYQSSVTAGPIFEKARMPLRVRLAVVWYLTNEKQGVSVLRL